jgi:hypothetical protein
MKLAVAGPIAPSILINETISADTAATNARKITSVVSADFMVLRLSTAGA